MIDEGVGGGTGTISTGSRPMESREGGSEIWPWLDSSDPQPSARGPDCDPRLLAALVDSRGDMSGLIVELKVGGVTSSSVRRSSATSGGTSTGSCGSWSMAD